MVWQFLITVNMHSSLKKAMAPHSSTLVWKIPWMEEPGRLQSMGSLRVGHDWATSLSLFTFHALEKEMATHSSVLAWRIPGTGEPGGLRSMGSHRVGHDWSDLAAAALIMWSSNPILSCLPGRKKNMCSHKNQLSCVHSRFIHNFPPWKQPRCTVIGEWMNKLVHPYGGIRFSNNKLWKHSVTSMNLTHIMLSGWNQRQKASYCMITNVGSRAKDLAPIKYHQGILEGDRAVLHYDCDG